MSKKESSKTKLSRKATVSTSSIYLPSGSIKVDISSVGTSSTSTSSPRQIRDEFKKAADKDTFIPPSLNE